jgi:tRNA threonylcarbamoyladenosine biosynthesis protein TsaB
MSQPKKPMLILILRTDKPEAEIGLYNDETRLAYDTWQADRQLAETLHSRLRSLLETHTYSLADLEAIAVFQGPGSFTGLRIGISVANALADGLAIPIVGTMGPHWIAEATKQLRSGDNQRIVLPEYGSPPHITLPKK